LRAKNTSSAVYNAPSGMSRRGRREKQKQASVYPWKLDDGTR
jgi:hypothetical protein